MSNSKEVFRLRKAKQLGDAYSLAIKLFSEEPNDEWIQKAYAWVLIDIVKIEINNNNIEKAQFFFNQLQSIDFHSKDEIIDKQINFIKPKLNTNYHEIQEAINLSKNGNYNASIVMFRNLYENKKLTNEHHESYGWAIYRLLSHNQDNLGLTEVKQYLMMYLKLNNPRPEMLHSFILQFAIIYSSKHNNLDIYKFFQIWNPQYLRNEDKEKQYKDGKTYPSLIEKIIRLLVDKNYNFDVKFLQTVIVNDLLVIETIRETYFWKLFNLQKENNLNELWSLFNYYINKYSNFGASHWHSEILKIAHRFMIEDNSWRFFDFFTKWNYKNFRSNDWQEEHNGEHTYKPLALQAITAINDHIKNKDIDLNTLLWIEELYQTAIKNIGHDKWLLRNYGIFLNKINKQDDAIQIYKDIIFDLSDQAYIWHEFSSLVENKDLDLSISMLCKAITVQKNEDFLGQIHLDLANLLVKINKLPEAKTELLKYEKQRTQKGWKLSDQFNQLNLAVQDIKENRSNEDFYSNHIENAEEYIYSDIEWTDLILYDQFKNKEDKKRLLFSDFKDIELMVNPFKFNILKNAKNNEIFKFKLYNDQSNDKYLVLKVDKSNLQKEDMIQNASSDIAIVDHINERKQLFHYVIDKFTDGIIRFNQTQLRPKVGDFIEIKYFKTFNKKQNKYKLNVLDILKTNEIKSSLIKESSGDVRLNIDKNGNKFGFVGDYFIPPYLVSKYKLNEDESICVKVLFNGEKWNVYELFKI